MNRFPSYRLRVEFDGPDVSQEMLYTLFRVSDKVQARLSPKAIWSSRRYTTPSTCSSRFLALRHHNILQDLLSHHSHQLREPNDNRTGLTAVTRLLNTHEYRRLHIPRHWRNFALISHAQPAESVLRASTQSACSSGLGLGTSEDSIAGPCFSYRNSELHGKSSDSTVSDVSFG